MSKASPPAKTYATPALQNSHVTNLLKGTTAYTKQITITSNSDLERERNRCTFNASTLTHMLDGGAMSTLRRRELESMIENDPSGIFDNSQNANMSRPERHTRALAKTVRMIELARSIGMGNDHDGHIIADDFFGVLLASVADDLPAALHWVMFVPNIMSLGDDEQQKNWLPLCRDWKMIGCYAQTELGHGSNVRGLETTATFRPGGSAGDGEWVIHSPTLTSGKFWPGTLGRTANHAMVIARLIDGNGVDRGMQNFLVPLRDMRTHQPLQGVTVADIGPKIGYNNTDNGLAYFDHVVIPRRNMAMRFATVDERGNFTKRKVSDAASKVAYVTMMQVRALIVNEAGKALAMAVTVCTRYSAVRRQGFKEKGSKTEVQILDYVQQQHRIFPLLAASYCFFFTGRQIMQRLRAIERILVQQKAGTANSVTKEMVADIHASSSCLKSFTTTIAADGIEECRKACGGHGFLVSSGLPELLGAYLAYPTVEGDNHMLPQQTVRVLLKMLQTLNSGGDVSAYKKCDSWYLVKEIQNIISSPDTNMCSAETLDDLLKGSTILQAFRHRAARLLLELAGNIAEKTSNGSSSETQQQNVWNQSLVQIARVSKAHSLALLMNHFLEGIQAESSNLGNAEIRVLNDLALLFGLYHIEKAMGDFLEDQYLTSSQSTLVRDSVLLLLKRVRINAVGLVDARDFTDFRLKSALGRKDGNVYPAIINESLMTGGLNDQHVGPGYAEHLRKLTVDGVGEYHPAAANTQLQHSRL